MSPFHCRPPVLSIALASIALMTAAAQSLSPAVDPVCGLPGLRLSGGSADAVYEVRASDDLGAPGVWEALMRIAPGTMPHTWFDPEAPGRGHRFYRLETVTDSPELLIENFALTDQNGVRHELFREGQANAVVLLFTDNAHLVKAWDAVKSLQTAYASKGVQIWLVNPVDTRADLTTACAAVGVATPVLHDLAQLVTRTYGPVSTLEAIAINRPDFSIFYRGSIADHSEGPAGSVEQTYLSDALKQFTDGTPVVIQSVRNRGEVLSATSTDIPDYGRDIAPLLQAKCVSCHRPGDIGSWAMTDHGVIADHSTAIRRSLLAGHMPPWHADPAFGRFANDTSLTPAEASRLVAWLDAGAPRSDGPDPLVIQPPPPPVAWPLGTPDVVLKIEAQTIPANGEIPYRYLLVKNPLRTNAWLRAATVLPGNRGVVHHSLVFTVQNAADFLQVQGGLGGFFAGYVPGGEPVEFPAGTGKLLKTGSYLVFQMHYTPNGKATSDQTQIGLYLAEAVPARELVTTAAYDIEFTIPPGAPDHQVSAERLIEKDSLLYEMSPHMHYRGARMRFEALYPNGTQETLLNIPGYEFAWQTLFRLKEPKRLPAGTRVRITGGFDNSSFNPWNPNPEATVLFGEQTSDEMLVGYLNLAVE